MAAPGTLYSFGMVGGSRLVVGTAAVDTNGATWDMCESTENIEAIVGACAETQGETPSAAVNSSNDYQLDVDNSGTGTLWFSVVISGQ